MKRLLIAILILFWGIATSLLGVERVGVINVQGAIVPATAEYISRAIKVSAQEGYECLVVLLDTPGGLLESTKVIIQQLLASPVPIVVYVYPQGANAASAGCFITLAADVAAMAPTTSIGAAHPVPMGLPGGGEKMDDAMKQKLSNFAASYIETIAARRKRNVEWARASVAESAAISAEKALEINVIDLIANDLKDLLVQLDGREVRPGKILKTANAEIIQIPMSLRERFIPVNAAGGHVHPYLNCNLWHNSRVESPRCYFPRGNWHNRSNFGALYGISFACECSWGCANIAWCWHANCRVLCSITRVANSRWRNNVFPRRADVV